MSSSFLVIIGLISQSFSYQNQYNQAGFQPSVKIDQYQDQDLKIDKYQQLDPDYLHELDSFVSEKGFEIPQPASLDRLGNTLADYGVAGFFLPAAIAVGLSALFSDKVLINSTAVNATVPLGLLALPTLPVRRRRSIGRKQHRQSRYQTAGPYRQTNGYRGGYPAGLGDAISVLSKDTVPITQRIGEAARLYVLMDGDEQCQAAVGCRYGTYARKMTSKIPLMTRLLGLMAPLKWTRLTREFQRTVQTKGRTNCHRYKCNKCVSLK